MAPKVHESDGKARKRIANGLLILVCFPFPSSEIILNFVRIQGSRSFACANFRLLHSTLAAGFFL